MIRTDSPFFVRVVFLLPESVLLRSAEMNGVDVSLVDGFDVALSRIGAKWRGAINAGDVDAVSWLHRVDEVVVGVDDDGVGSLTGRHVVRRFLQFDHLFVGEMRPIVNQRIREIRVAVGTDRWLGDFAAGWKGNQLELNENRR